MQLIRLTIIAGFIIGLIGILIALPADDRSLGFGIFMVGFFLAAGGIIANMFVVPESSETQPVLPGLRIAAIGFGIVLLGAFFSIVFDKENLSSLFFYGGFIVFMIGILFGIFGVAKSKR
jgi:hypothetical protein